MKSLLSGKRLLCIWLPNWPIQRLRVAERSNEEVLKRSIILWGNDPRRGRLVVAACEQASARGIRPSMSLSQATALAEGNEKLRPATNDSTLETTSAAPQQPNAILNSPWIAAHDNHADKEALQSLAHQCSGYLSPYIAIEPLDDDLWAGQTLHQPQSLFLDITGIGTLFGGETHLLNAASGFLESLGYEGRLAIADTIGTAWAVAHYEPPNETRLCATPQPSRMPAWIVPSGQQALALEPLRIAALRVSRETTSTLRRLGINTIGALRKVPRSGLASRLDSHLLQRLDEALGDRDEPLSYHQSPICSQTTVDLEYPTTDSDILAHRLTVACQTLAPSLRSQQQGALQIVCRFQTTEHHFVLWRLGFFTPTADADHWERLLSTHLQRETFPAPIQKFFFSVVLTGPLEIRQPTLIDLGNENASLRDWAQLVDTLSGRLGRERVLGVSQTDHPLPEHAFAFRPLTGQPPGTLVPGRPNPRTPSRKRLSRSKRAPRSIHAETMVRSNQSQLPTHWNTPYHESRQTPFHRPLRLLSPPQSLTPSEQHSESETPPSTFLRGGQKHHLARWWGPERVETGWWHGPLQRRDYFRVELATGQWWWVYHDLRHETWWLQGFFS